MLSRGRRRCSFELHPYAWRSLGAVHEHPRRAGERLASLVAELGCHEYPPTPAHVCRAIWLPEVTLAEIVRVGREAGFPGNASRPALDR